MTRFLLSLAVVVAILGIAIIELYCAGSLFSGSRNRIVYFAFPRPAIAFPRGRHAVHDWVVKPAGCEVGIIGWSSADVSGSSDALTDVLVGPLVLRFHSSVPIVGIYILLLLAVIVCACTWIIRRKDQHA